MPQSRNRNICSENRRHMVYYFCLFFLVYISVFYGRLNSCSAKFMPFVENVDFLLCNGVNVVESNISKCYGYLKKIMAVLLMLEKTAFF